MSDLSKIKAICKKRICCVGCPFGKEPGCILEWPCNWDVRKIRNILKQQED